MKQVFLDQKGEITLDKTNDSVYSAEIHFYQNPQKSSFEEEIEVLNDEGLTLNYIRRQMSREMIYKIANDPRNNGISLVYFENITAL